jgi:hypothetical protein
MREASDRITTIHTQNTLLLSHQTRLEALDSKMEAGHEGILSRISSLGPMVKGPPRPVSAHATQRSSRKYRLTLPRWFTETVWELGVNTCEGGWNFQLRQINIRPYTTRAFDAVRSGNLEDVRRLLTSGELSLSDYEYDYHGKHKALLTVSGPCLESRNWSDKPADCSRSWTLRALRVSVTRVLTLPQRRNLAPRTDRIPNALLAERVTRIL